MNTTDSQRPADSTAAHGSASLTKSDIEALKRLPDGWFPLHRVSYMVRNPRWRCDRLVELGVMERRVVGEYPALVTEWRKTQNAELSESARENPKL